MRRDGRVLLGLRAGGRGAGTWGFPGGAADPGESPLEAGARELLEETGLVATNLEPATWTTSEHADGSVWLVLFVYADADGDPLVVEPRKCRAWRLFDWDALPENLFHGPARLRARGWRPAGV